LGEEQVDEAVMLLKLLADPTRLRIVWALLHGEHSVNELSEHVGAQPAAVSQHLTKLRMARVVRRRREGNRIYYSAADHHIGRVAEEAVSHTDHLAGDVGHRRRPPASARTA